MAEFVPISEAKARLSELAHTSEHEDVVLMRHGRAAAVIMSVDRHAELIEQLEDLEDRLSVYEARDDDVAVPWEKLKAELGLG
jgi:antitoxin StbD